jgi:hypothetical protein
MPPERRDRGRRSLTPKPSWCWMPWPNGTRAEIKAAKTAFSARKLPNIRMEDLVGKLELDVSVRAEEVATVLYHELEELKERLNTVEKALRKSKSPPEATKPS